ncbi:MAG: hypothetical protein MPJ24_07415 [Pirellulaceae bacterium]|nr:hypothetical protein [Pirellulaceae bacterium]
MANSPPLLADTFQKLTNQNRRIETLLDSLQGDIDQLVEASLACNIQKIKSQCQKIFSMSQFAECEEIAERAQALSDAAEEPKGKDFQRNLIKLIGTYGRIGKKSRSQKK